MKKFTVFTVQLPVSMSGHELMLYIKMTINDKGNFANWFFMAPAIDTSLWRVGRASDFQLANLAIYPSEEMPFFHMEAQYRSVLVKWAQLPIYHPNPQVLDDSLIATANDACKRFAVELAERVKGEVSSS